MDYRSFDEEVRTSPILSKQLISTLLETQEYNHYSFINWAIETLSIIKIRIERGDKIYDEVSNVLYTPASFQEFVSKHFQECIVQDVFSHKKDKTKYYFQLKKSEYDDYQLVLAPDGKQKTFEWISSLSDHFSLVYMIATNIVYIKNLKTGTYNALISENGKYCRYNKKYGKIEEIK